MFNLFYWCQLKKKSVVPETNDNQEEQSQNMDETIFLNQYLPKDFSQRVCVKTDIMMLYDGTISVQ